MKIKKGDQVKIIKGKDRGKDGKIERVFGKSEKVLILGLNLFKRHMKKRSEEEKGQIVDVPRPMPVANVALMCPKCKLPTRVGYEGVGKNKKRICRKCKQNI